MLEYCVQQRVAGKGRLRHSVYIRLFYLVSCPEFDGVNGFALNLAQTENRQRLSHRPFIHSVTSYDRSLRLGSLCRLIASNMNLRYTQLMFDSMHISSIRQSALGFHIRVKTSASQACPLLFSLMRKQVGSATRGRCPQLHSLLFFFSWGNFE